MCVVEREKQREGRKRRKRTRRLDYRDYSGVCVDGEGGGKERKKDDRRQYTILYKFETNQVCHITPDRKQTHRCLALIQIFEYGRAKETGSTTKQGDGVP